MSFSVHPHNDRELARLACRRISRKWLVTEYEHANVLGRLRERRTGVNVEFSNSIALLTSILLPPSVSNTGI